VQTEKDLFVIYGRQPVIEALKSSIKINELWLAKDLNGKVIRQINRLAENKNVVVHSVNKNEIQKITGAVVHQGIAALSQPLDIGSEKDLGDFFRVSKKFFVVVMDQIQDPHNLGAILRTADICGVDAVILPEKGSAQLTSTVAKTSTGALFHLKIFLVKHLEKCFEIFDENHISSFALLPGAQRSMYELRLTESLAIVIGSEGQGVRKNIAQLCSDKITIPQFGNIDSLNASVAGAVVMYEVVRQRKFAG